MKKRLSILIAIAGVGIAYTAVMNSDFMRFSRIYLACGLQNRIAPFKGYCGDCVIDTNSKRIHRPQIEVCYGDPVWSSPAIYEAEPKSFIDFWLLKTTNINDFAVTCPGPLCSENLRPKLVP